MAVVQCKKCGKRIRDKETVCPYCGTSTGVKQIKTPTFEKEDRKPEPSENELLITCRACGEQISKNAVACPHCGEPIPKIYTGKNPKPVVQVKEKGIPLWVWLVGILLIAGLIGKMFEEPKKVSKINYSGVEYDAGKFNTGIKEGSVIATYGRDHWRKEYGGQLPANFKINLWENSLYWNKGKGKVKGYTIPGNNLVVLTVNENDYLVSDRQTGSIGWISKMQIIKKNHSDEVILTGHKKEPKLNNNKNAKFWSEIILEKIYDKYKDSKSKCTIMAIDDKDFILCNYVINGVYRKPLFYVESQTMLVGVNGHAALFANNNNIRRYDPSSEDHIDISGILTHFDLK